jgi:hypothetical protein
MGNRLSTLTEGAAVQLSDELPPTEGEPRQTRDNAM